MSEKLDGVRAYWTGEEFVSRLGNRYLAPDWFTEGLPSHPLDGELWIGRGHFQKTVSVVRRAKGGELWREVRYLVFDAPEQGGHFEARHEHLSELLAAQAPFAEAVAHERCEGPDHLQEELARIEELGGEGLMLRQPKSPYEVGRSWTLLKVKSFCDAEAKVVGYTAGKGKHKGKTGALCLVTPEGIEFSVGTGLSEKERLDPPAIGSIVTYRFQELTNKGVPRFPTYVGERADAEWPGEESGEVRAVAEQIEGSEETSMGRGETRRFENAQLGKFWSITVRDAACVIRSGKLGEDGREQVMDFDDDDEALEVAGTLIEQKTGKGYVEAEDDMGDTRYFELVDGSSSKFWEITCAGESFRVRYGKIGAEGRTQVKEFDDEEESSAVAETLIAQKLKKGYVEGGGGAKSKAAAKAPAKKSAAPSAGGEIASGETRYYEYHDAKSSKFWEITLADDSHTVRYGRVGTKGQSKTKDFKSAAAAQAAAQKLIGQKTGKGYEAADGGGGGGAAPAAKAGAAPKKAAAAKKPAAKPKAKAAASGAGELAEDEPRRFELVSGSSNKFWEITLSGTGFTVRYGKIGSDGRSQTKDFKSGDEARQVALELIGQKTKKGYVEC